MPEPYRINILKAIETDAGKLRDESYDRINAALDIICVEAELYTQYMILDFLNMKLKREKKDG